MRRVAIIGGGPAGAMAAERLARAGTPVTVFEENAGWEKPCGGGLTGKALHRYPFLREATEPHASIYEADFSIAGGSSVLVRLRTPIAVYSRAVLNRRLLDHARRAGAGVVEDRILSFSRTGKGWQLAGRRSSYTADFIVLAGGSRSRLRTLLTPDFASRDFMLTFGHYIPSAERLLRVQVWQGFEGYAWAFPRPDHLSVGICGKVGGDSMPELRDRLHSFMQTFGYDGRGCRIFAHLLPALGVATWMNLRLAGPGWALAGDAAGLVDPLTGEGICFAMRSGEVLAESLLERAENTYPERIWRDFGGELAHAARLSRPFYHGDFLGRNLATWMIALGQYSSTVVDVLQDLLDGAQPYSTLATRLGWGLLGCLAEAGRSSLALFPPPWRSVES